MAQLEAGAVAEVQEPEEEGEGLKSAHWSDAENDEMEPDTSSWCFAAVTMPRGPASTLLVDSGADDHTCHPDFAKESPSKKSTEVTFRDVQSNKKAASEH